MNRDVINQVLVLFIILLVGMYSKKKGIVDEKVNKGLSELLLKVTLPSMIITSFNYDFSKEMLNNSIKLFLYSVLIHIILFLVSLILFRGYSKEKKSVLSFITIFSNSGFMGYPILQSIYGKIGVFYGAIFNMVFNIFLWTVGVMLFTGFTDLKKNIKNIFNPGFISVFIGMIIFIFSIKLPYAIDKAFSLIGAMTTPISMIVIGAMLADTKIKDIFSVPSVYYASFLRLLIAPLITYGFLKLIGAEGIVFGVSVVIQAMPAAVMTGILAEKYGGDTILSSKAIFITTLFSILTIPIILTFLQ